MNDFVFTKHAKIRMFQRKINEEEIKSTIDKLDITEESFKERTAVIKKFPNGNLKVIYKIMAAKIIIITCYWVKEG